MTEIYALVAGTLYGLLIGIIPSAGATTGLVALFGFISHFANEPYLGVIFCMAVVAASTTGDTYTGVLLGIPGANSASNNGGWFSSLRKKDKQHMQLQQR